MSDNMKKHNRMIDCVKLIASVIVVFTHIQFPGIVGTYIASLCGFCVPFFFLISGYYADGFSENGRKHLIYKLKRITIIFLLSFLLYFVYQIVFGLYFHRLDEYLEKFNFKSIANIALLCNTFSFACGHLWFLVALIECYLFYIILSHIFKERILTVLIILSPIVWILALYFRNSDLGLNYVFIFSGWTYFSLANILSKYNNIVLRIPNNIIIVVMGLYPIIKGVFLTIDCLYEEYIISIIVATMAISIFLFCLKNSEKTLGKFIETSGKRYSMYIYIFHMIVQYVIYQIANHWLLCQEIWFEWLFPLMVLLGSYCAGMIVYFFNKKFIVSRMRKKAKLV